MAHFLGRLMKNEAAIFRFFAGIGMYGCSAGCACFTFGITCIFVLADEVLRDTGRFVPFGLNSTLDIAWVTEVWRGIFKVGAYGLPFYVCQTVCSCNFVICASHKNIIVTVWNKCCFVTWFSQLSQCFFGWCRVCMSRGYHAEHRDG